ncbi:WhiB family transcriptional regulator [Mycobacteroides abscessus]|uniref:WhiB family transcriptional regulator n=1 Tax=Mycobacteroides abscessus TaxID=36809 RepID=UPI000C25ED0A|nr:WhiB family transcriptional regulator [Mycobacteroides abscessus]
MSEIIPIEGSCRDMPVEAVDEFFFEAPLKNSRAKIEMARRICRNCVALDECRDMALETNPPYGIFGAMSPADRNRILSGDGGVA